MTAGNVGDVLGAAYKLTDWLNFYWNFSVIFAAAILGWVFSAKNPWGTAQKVVITAMYGLFVIINIDIMIRTYIAIQSAVEWLESNWMIADGFKPALLNKLAHPYWGAHIAGHLLADILVFYCLWTKTPKEAPSALSEHDKPRVAGPGRKTDAIQ
jgi:hypothetical protein